VLVWAANHTEESPWVCATQSMPAEGISPSLQVAWWGVQGAGMGGARQVIAAALGLWG